MIGTTGDMIDSDRAIPRQTPVAFEIAVKAQQFSIRITGYAVSIPLAAGDEFAMRTVGIHPDNETTRRLATGSEASGVLGAREHQIISVITVRRARQQVRRNIAEITAEDVQVLLIRVQQNGVCPMVPATAPPLTNQLHLVKLVVRRRRTTTEESVNLPTARITTMGMHIKTIESEEHPHHLAQR